MGRGDKKSKKGKRFAGSYGRVRVRKTATKKFEAKAKVKETNVEVKTEKKTTPKKKTTTKKKTSKKEE